MWVVTRVRDEDLKKVYLTWVPSWTDDVEQARKFNSEEEAKLQTVGMAKGAVELL